MTKLRVLATTLLLAAVPLGCGQRASTSATSARVLAITPLPAPDTGDVTPLEIKFDEPMVAESAVGKAVAQGDIVLSPAMPFTAVWQTRQTIRIEAKGEINYGVNFTVAVAGDLERQAGPYKSEFANRLLEFYGISGDAGMLTASSTLPVEFSTPVAATEVVNNCNLRKLDSVASAGNRPFMAGNSLNENQYYKDLALKAPKLSLQAAPAAKAEPGASKADYDSQERHTTLVKPVKPLDLDTHYAMVCDGVHSKNGQVLKELVVVGLQTHGPLKIEQVSPKDETVRAVGSRIEITFSTPVREAAIRAALSSTPAIPNLGDGWLSNNGQTYNVAGKFKGFTDYQVTVAGLVDIFDQKLAAPETFSFKVSDAHPALSIATGTSVIEAGNSQFPIWARNVGSYTVNCATVAPSKLDAVTNAGIDYAPRWESKDPGINWAALGLQPRTVTQTLTKDSVEYVAQEPTIAELCGGNGPGIYLIEVASADIRRETKDWNEPYDRARALVNVTNLGVVIKAGADTGLVWVTDMTTGAPVAGAAVQLVDRAGKTRVTATSNQDGIVRFSTIAFRPVPAKAAVADDIAAEGANDFDGAFDQTSHMTAVVQRGTDIAVTRSDWNDGLQSWNFGVASDSAPAALRGFIQSDRGLYRPGDQVRFKGLLRDVANGRAASVPQATTVTVAVKDSRDEEVFTGTAMLTRFGGFTFDYQLPITAHTGDYYVSAQLAGQTFRERFAVEEYRTATFTANMSANANKTELNVGDPIAVTVKASYLFGAPVANGAVKWHISRRSHSMAFPGFEGFNFDATAYHWWDYRYQDDGNEIKDGTGVTDNNGVLTIREIDPDATSTDIRGTQDYIITATVKDQSNQGMSASTVVTAHRQDLYPGARTEDYVQAAGKAFAVDTVAVGPDGKQLGFAGTLTWTKQAYDCEWKSYGNRDAYECSNKVGSVGTQQVSVAATGTSRSMVTIKEPGSYELKLTGKDRAGRDVTTTTDVWVTGKGDNLWASGDGNTMKLIVGKSSYKVGETARLVAQANLKQASTLIVVERAGILDVRVVPASAGQFNAVQLPIVAGWGPNVFASVTMVSGRTGAGDRGRPQLKMGIATINVESKDRELDVKIELDAGTHRPGDTVTGKIKVTHAGVPVAAELAVAVADEGVLKLIDYKTPNPMLTFYAPWLYGVNNASNLPMIMRPVDPTTEDADEGGDFASSNDAQKVRTKFMATAFWAPTLQTDSNGEVTFSFVAPDNLTTFRVMAVAADAGAMFGSGELPLLVTKPLVLAPALTRILRAGDQATMGVLVNNRTTTAGLATVTMQVTGAVATVASAQVQVPANGTARVNFPIVASDGEQAQFTFAATLGANRDALTLPVPIVHTPQITQRTVASLDVTAATPFAQTLRADPATLLAQSEAIVTIDRSGLGELEPSLRYLVEYPYGCLEQTLSHMVPLVAARELSQSVGGTAASGDKARAYINVAVAKLQRHQHADGNFSLWPDSQTYPHLTAYAVWGLDLAARGGVDVPKAALTNGINALSKWADEQKVLVGDGDAAALAMGTYVAAVRGTPMRPAMTRLYEIRATLPRWGQAFLWRAMVKAKSPAVEIAEMRALVVAGIAVQGALASVTETAKADYDHMHSNVRAAAMVLDALLEVAPKDALVPKLVAGLLAARNKAGTWESTQDNVWSLLALAGYAKRQSGGTGSATISVAGKIIASPTLQGAKVVTLRIPLTQLQNAELKITTSNNAHISVRTREIKPAVLKAEANGMRVEREYLDRNGKAVTEVHTGELLTVKLTVWADEASSWVAIADRMPAGLEPVNTKLTATVENTASNQDQEDCYDCENDWWVSYAELRDDQAWWFIDRLSAGSNELTYQVRATTPGVFTAPAATIERMYEPTVNGHSAEQTIKVTDDYGVGSQTAITKPAKAL